MENFEQGFEKGHHLGPGEIKALILIQILRGNSNVSDLKTEIRKVVSLKNNRDVIYHLNDPRYGLEQEGLIKIRNNRIEISTHDAVSLTRLCFLLFSNHEVALKMLQSFESMRDLSFTFIQNKNQFIREVKDYRYIYENYSEDFQRLRKEGEDPLEIFSAWQSPDEFKDNIGLILHAIESNLIIDGYVERGVKDPPYELHGEFFATGLRGMKKTRGYEMGYFPIKDPELEKRAVREFIEGILMRVAREEIPRLSMLTLSSEKKRLIGLLHRTEMALNSLRDMTSSEIASLIITKSQS